MAEDEGNIRQAMLQLLFEKTGKRFSEKIMESGLRPTLYGSLQNPDSCARVTSDCGDTIEFYLRFRNGKVEEARFTSEGCVTTVAAAQAAAEMATGRTIRQCLGINQSSISEYLDGLPAENDHCARLAALALHRALRDYVVHRKGP
jgi:nitrogen fixation NifU-like protein